MIYEMNVEATEIINKAEIITIAILIGFDKKFKNFIAINEMIKKIKIETNLALVE